MQFSDKKTDETIRDLLRAAGGNADLLDRAMLSAMREAQKNNKTSVNKERIIELIHDIQTKKNLL